MLFIHSHKTTFLLFLLYNDVYFEYTQRMFQYKKMAVKELQDFLFENYYRRIGFTKENNYYSVKHLKKKILKKLRNDLMLIKVMRVRIMLTF